MAQWINLNRNNRSVLVSLYSVFEKKIAPILPPLVGLMAERQGERSADKLWVDFEILKLTLQVKLLGLLFF